MTTLKQSMATLGCQNPIKVSQADGCVVLCSGSKRMAVALELGWSEIPAIDVDTMRKFQLQLADYTDGPANRIYEVFRTAVLIHPNGATALPGWQNLSQAQRDGWRAVAESVKK